MRAVMRLDESIVIHEEVGLRGIHKKHAIRSQLFLLFLFLY